MNEELSFDEISELFEELDIKICQKEDFVRARAAWSSSKGKKLANIKTKSKVDEYNEMIRKIRIMDEAYENHMELVYRVFCELARDILRGNKTVETRYRQKLESEARSELNLCPKLAIEFGNRYKRDNKITYRDHRRPEPEPERKARPEPKPYREHESTRVNPIFAVTILILLFVLIILIGTNYFANSRGTIPDDQGYKDWPTPAPRIRQQPPTRRPTIPGYQRYKDWPTPAPKIKQHNNTIHSSRTHRRLDVNVCRREGLQRRVEVFYFDRSRRVPCEVRYYKDTENPGVREVLWKAKNETGYCERQSQKFVDKLKSWGWICE